MVKGRGERRTREPPTAPERTGGRGTGRGRCGPSSPRWAGGEEGVGCARPLVWTAQQGDWLPEGDASRRSRALHSTFNVLVGAQPVPSIECSLSKLKHRKARWSARAASSRVSCRRAVTLTPSPPRAPCPLWPRSLRHTAEGLLCLRGPTPTSPTPVRLYRLSTQELIPDTHRGCKQGESTL